MFALSAHGAGTQPPVVDEQAARALVRTLLVPSPYRIGEAARRGEIHYRLAFADGIAREFPETGEQTVSADGDQVVVRVCANCGVDTMPGDVRPYLAANPWVQSDDRAIKAFARRYGRGRGVDVRMSRLAEAVRAHMDGPVEFRHYDSAVTALGSRSGDCTEFALLLAATARARGIPARIVYGLAYSSRFTGQSHVFSPHAWVQAWDGKRWRSYDAGLGRFDAGHIALLVGDGRPEGLNAVLRTIAAVRIVDAAGVRGPVAGRR
jgi:transglutaminase-like putative cysteine protease